MKVDYKVVGAKELERFLVKELPAQVARRVLLSSLREASKPMINLAKATATGPSGRRRSGALAASIGAITIASRKVPRLQLPPGLTMKDSAAAIAIGPLSGQGSKPLLAWSMYQAYYNRGVIKLKRGAPIGRIRHGHLIEFGFKHKKSGKMVKGTHFLERAAVSMGPTMAIRMLSSTRRRTMKAVKKHNSSSPARSK